MSSGSLNEVIASHRVILCCGSGGVGKTTTAAALALQAARAGRKAVVVTIDPAKRLALVGEAQNYVIDQAYVIPIFEEPQAFAGAPWVKGVGFEAVGRPSFYAAWLAKH